MKLKLKKIKINTQLLQRAASCARRLPYKRILRTGAVFALAFCCGNVAARFVDSRTVNSLTVSASADGNWGLSFPVEGQPPVGNATSDYLKQYNAHYVQNTQDKVIYLTFDAGYENGNTAAILDALKKHSVPATFFLVGNYLETSPDLVKRMAAEGHIVANHTYHHPDMSKISTREAFEKELNDLEALYQQTTGQTMKKYYRPPQGKYSEENLKMANDMGYHTFFWSLAYVDWYKDKQPTKEEAFKKLLGRIHPGAVVLLHSTSSTNAQILDELLTKWEEMGYHFASLDDLVNASAQQ
ncbi:delta-lactam-biosynthetic de-N-acetylase [Clostridium sp. AM58-1XD]|uniref:delta-lactam-biosynthetic de-N-acetylase n=1 Tax=Clostridium sp. AM58-1XD TaxID=2292307 RepID=UPI000E4DFBD4|nr:delta-lactam-biosynthetic de-N-acetylase [Clostridium sp. AM58-1XD]RGZ00436.1 delta-lactam-biosynthetic de-N-acetylase [Clostridium sp. AM58-1XD]